MTRATLDPGTAQQLRDRLPAMAEETVLAVIAEVPGYAGWLHGEMRASIGQAVQMALGGWVRLAEAGASDPGTPQQAALAAAYELGRGEARSGRTMDALLAAYRVGARAAWRTQSSVLVDAGQPAAAIAQFAGLVFAYIDELSAASAAGHADEQATTGRVRELYLERLGALLVDGAPGEELEAAAERAGWSPPGTLTAVLVPEAQVRRALAVLDAGTLRLPGDATGLDEVAILLVPDAGGDRRARLLEVLQERQAVVGPTRPWTHVVGSVNRAGRLRASKATRTTLDTEAHLASLLTTSDPDALADLRAHVLSPLADLRPGVRLRLEQTLRSWLLHQGRRDDVAADLVVHPQTVRYRMTQVRELYGERLRDPATVFDLVVALGAGAVEPRVRSADLREPAS
ncbi:MAG: putative transcriptional regulator, PucR family [Solirubrobacterales bacterium]|jgi:hypothetical protein|nr:putative transcriptional regulator, PucR family [Solirubrobacterales bacterium]